MQILGLLLGCGLKTLLPGPPALDAAERAAFDSPAPARVTYTGPAKVAFPVLPVQAWGLRYALDIVLVSQHPQFTMHEYARIDLPDGPLWLAKDADTRGNQTIVANVPSIESWVPEVPVDRIAGEVKVEDRSDAEHLDLLIAYDNVAGERTEVRYEGKQPTRPSNPRNGNTMGHSRATVAALLDLHLFRAGGDVTMTFDGQEVPIKRLWGIYPMTFALAQTQGGFAIADFRQEPAEGGFRLVRPSSDDLWPTRSDEAWTVADEWARRDGTVTSLRYHFRDGGLDRVQVWQVGAELVPVVDMVFRPALPDLSRPFLGIIESDFAVDIAGQRGHGTGRIRCRWTDDDTVTVEMIPTAPEWFADRPMVSDIRVTGSGVTTRIRRVGVGTPH